MDDGGRGEGQGGGRGAGEDVTSEGACDAGIQIRAGI
jgi:hypothetical protein